jgi:putative nucleotidyltransferase with HDIG domain
LERSTAGTTTVILNLTRTVNRDRYETKHRRKDGSEFEAEVTVGSLDDAQGRSILFIRDVSDRRAQRIRERSQQHRLEALVELFLHADEMDEHALMMRTSEHLARAATSPLAFVYVGNATAPHWSSTAWFDSVAGKAHFDEEIVPLEAAPQWMLNVRDGRAVLNNDLTAITQAKPLPPLHRHLAMPVTFDEDGLLLVGVANRLRDYNDDDRRELKRLGELLGRLLRNKRARIRTLATLKKTEVALEATLTTLLAVAERHDPYTAGSTIRVAELAVAIGRELGLDGAKQHALRTAAMLHDIGSTAVPRELLARPAPLTAPEYALVQLHAAEGAKLLNGMDLDGPIAEIVHQHHERWNGSGYPRGLAGEAILLEARIIAVADVVEAMCSNRPHRAALGSDAALDEIQRNAGRLYDKKVVDACVNLFFEKGFKWDSR